MLRQIKLQKQRQNKDNKILKVDIEFLPGGDSTFPDIIINEVEKNTKYYPVKTGIDDGTLYQKEGEEGIFYQNDTESLEHAIKRTEHAIKMANDLVKSITEAYENGNLTINGEKRGQGEKSSISELEQFLDRFKTFSDKVNKQLVHNFDAADLKMKEIRKNYDDKSIDLEKYNTEIQTLVNYKESIIKLDELNKSLFENIENIKDLGGFEKSKAEIPTELLNQLPTLKGVISSPEERLAQVNVDDVTAKLAAEGLNGVKQGGDDFQRNYASTQQEKPKGINV